MPLRLAQMLFFLLLVAFLYSCAPLRVSHKIPHSQEAILVSSSEIAMTYMPQQKRTPAHIIINKTLRYVFSQNQIPESFTKELSVNPLMHNISCVAEVQKNGKIIRKYPALKTAQNLLSLVVPYLKPEEEVVIKSSYNFMDPRSMAPIFMQEAEPTLASKLTIDVPYGVNLRHKAAYLGEALVVAPQIITFENSSWGTRDNSQGRRFIFEQQFDAQNNYKKTSDRQQLFLAFDAPAERDKKTLFENWESVSNYLYNRIDRYDLPSNIIRDFSVKKTSNSLDDNEKIAQILSFLNTDMEKRSVLEPLLEQAAHPASIILNKRSGSALELVILAKSMLSSLNIDSDIVAVSDPEKNPRIHDFYTPALFNKIILVIYNNSENLYYDPSQNSDRFDQVPSNLQGQQALLVKQSGSQFFSLPYESAEKNRISYFYDLALSNSGILEGSFSVDLSGIKADEAKFILAKENPVLSASALQDKLQQSDSTLRWQKASFNQTQESEIINFTGSFSPRLLAPSPEQGFSLPIKEIFEPILLPLINSTLERYSSFSSLEAALHYPTNFKITQSKPVNFFIDHKGLRARFFVTWEENTVVFKGESMISLPIKAEADFKLALPEDRLSIVEIGAQPEASREASVNTAENS